VRWPGEIQPRRPRQDRSVAATRSGVAFGVRKARRRSGCVRRKSVAGIPPDGNKDAAHGLPHGRRFQTMVNPRVAEPTGCASERQANGNVDKEPASTWSSR